MLYISWFFLQARYTILDIFCAAYLATTMEIVEALLSSCYNVHKDHDRVRYNLDMRWGGGGGEAN